VVIIDKVDNIMEKKRKKNKEKQKTKQKHLGALHRCLLSQA